MARTFARVGCFALLGILGAVAASAAGPAGSTGFALEATAAVVVPSPWVNRAVSSPVENKIEVAFDLAVRRLHDVPACASLFDDLELDGLGALSRSMYFPVPLWRERSVCRGAHAVTVVGWRPVLVCRNFAQLSDSHAAMLLIHEALHLAGLAERPSDPAAMSGAAINRMVVEACRLERGLTFEQAIAYWNGP